MSGFQRVVSVLPDGKMSHNNLQNIVRLLGQAFEARGVEHLIVDEHSPSFERDLLKYASDPANAIYLGHRFYDLTLGYFDAGGGVRRNLFEVLDRPVFGLIHDHPFSRFMWKRMESASRTTHFIAPTPEFQAEAQFINPGLEHFHTVPPATTEPDLPSIDVRPLAERSVDIFMSGIFSITRPSLEDLRRHYAAVKSPLVKVIDEVYETGVVERDRSIMTLFLEAIERHFGKSLVISCPMTEGDAAVMEVLSCIDMRIRADRRLKILRNLARLDPSLRIVVTLEPGRRAQLRELQDRPNIELTGWIEAARNREIFLESRFAINVCPTYTTYVTERVPNAMVLGCCVVSDKNRHLASIFAESEEILFMDDCDVSVLSQHLRGDLDRAQAIATRGREKALARFSFTDMADGFLDVMRSTL